MKSKKNIILNSNNEENKQVQPSFYRIIFVGDKEVGKTQIINIYNNKVFQNEYFPTFTVDFQIKTINFNGKKINIHCIDTEGSIDISEIYKDTGASFIQKADAFILVYDITSRISFNTIYKYFESIRLQIFSLEKNNNKKLLYLVGNKYDLRTSRNINENEAIQLANKYNAKYTEVSAKIGLNVDKLFECVIQDITRKDTEEKINIKNNRIYRPINNIINNYTIGGNIDKNEIDNENESKVIYETSTNFLKTNNYINLTNGYNNNNINNFQGIQNNNNINKSYYFNGNPQNKCQIF